MFLDLLGRDAANDTAKDRRRALLWLVAPRTRAGPVSPPASRSGFRLDSAKVLLPAVQPLPLPSATRQTDVPRVDIGHVHVRHVDVRDVYVPRHVDVRDVEVAEIADAVEGRVLDGSRAELDIRWIRDGGGKNRRCGGESCREKRCEIGASNLHGKSSFRQGQAGSKKVRTVRRGRGSIGSAP